MKSILLAIATAIVLTSAPALSVQAQTSTLPCQGEWISTMARVQADGDAARRAGRHSDAAQAYLNVAGYHQACIRAGLRHDGGESIAVGATLAFRAYEAALDESRASGEPVREQCELVRDARDTSVLTHLSLPPALAAAVRTCRL